MNEFLIALISLASIIGIIILIAFYITHREMLSEQRVTTVKTWVSFKEFKREFNKVEWRRNLDNKYSFFADKYEDYDKNYVHASIVIINNTGYIFNPIAFYRFLLFTFLNRTTNKNYNDTVNSLRDIRKSKLKKIGI